MSSDSGDIVDTISDQELAIIVLDGSGSMSFPEVQGNPLTKAQAIREQLADPKTGLFAEIQRGGRANQVDFVVLVFDTSVETRIPRAPAAELDLEAAYDNLDVLRGHGKDTNISQALDEAGVLALQFADTQTDPPRYATILLMSDGIHNTGSIDPTEVAANIHTAAEAGDDRPSIVIACAPYGDQADNELLRKMATPGFYQKCRSAKEIRAFFIRSMRSRGA